MSNLRQNKLISPTTFLISDDGTNWEFAVGGTKLWQVNKTTGQFQVTAGYDTDISL